MNNHLYFGDLPAEGRLKIRSGPQAFELRLPALNGAAAVDIKEAEHLFSHAIVGILS